MPGITLSNDPLSDKRFDFQFVNPPDGCEWSMDYAAQVKDSLFDIKPLHQAIDAIYEAPLTEAATLRDTLLPKLLSGELTQQIANEE